MEENELVHKDAYGLFGVKLLENNKTALVMSAKLLSAQASDENQVTNFNNLSLYCPDVCGLLKEFNGENIGIK